MKHLLFIRFQIHILMNNNFHVTFFLFIFVVNSNFAGLGDCEVPSYNTGRQTLALAAEGINTIMNYKLRIDNNDVSTVILRALGILGHESVSSMYALLVTLMD